MRILQCLQITDSTSARCCASRTLGGQERWEEAVKQLSKAFPILKAEYGPEHRRTRTAAEALVQSLEALGRADAADPYRPYENLDK